jgi:hypothetical protein
MKKHFLLLGMLAAVTVWASAEMTVNLGGTVFWDEDGAGANFILPQVGYMSAEKEYIRADRDIADFRGVPVGTPVFSGWKFRSFDYSIFIDLGAGCGFENTKFNFSGGMTAEFYFVPVFSTCRIGAGIGGGWGFIDVLKDNRQNPYGAPYVRATIPFLVSVFKLGVRYDFYFTDKPYTQFNIFLTHMF